MTVHHDTAGMTLTVTHICESVPRPSANHLFRNKLHTTTARQRKQDYVPRAFTCWLPQI